MSSFGQPLRMLFARHELWAVETAMRFPFFALFIHATLWVWGLPVFPILLLLSAIGEGSLIGAAVVMAIGIPLLLVFFIWFVRWYLICAGLMIGRRTMAENKRTNVRTRLRLSDA